ncbi:hypothetical protein GCM10020295_42460 [Streptomyces cinereospinus]
MSQWPKWSRDGPDIEVKEAIRPLVRGTVTNSQACTDPPVVPHQVHRTVRAHRVRDGQEVVRQLLQREPAAQRPRRRRPAVAPDVVQHDVEVSGEADRDLGPHFLAVRVAVHEDHRRLLRIPQLGHAQLDPARAHPALPRSCKHRHSSSAQRRTPTRGASLAYLVTSMNVTVVQGRVKGPRGACGQKDPRGPVDSRADVDDQGRAGGASGERSGSRPTRG